MKFSKAAMKMLLMQALCVCSTSCGAFLTPSTARHAVGRRAFAPQSAVIREMSTTSSDKTSTGTTANSPITTTTSTVTSASERASAVESFKVMDVLKRANELQAMGREILHCEVGQPESGAPYPVAQAAVEALMEPKVMGYTDAFGLLELREKVAEHYQQKYGKSVSTDRIVITTGSSGGFVLAFTACFDVGDTIAIASSGYPCYRNVSSALGLKFASIPINDEFKITAKELGGEIQRRKEAGESPLKGLILSSPSNPTGAMLSPEELKQLSTLCEQEGVLFLSDEIYHGISYGKPEATAMQYSDQAIIINSFSKYFSMSGWRLGWMVVPEFLVDSINNLQQNMFINAPTVSQTAALKCWDDDTEDELQKHVEKYRTSRQIILEELGLHENDTSSDNYSGFKVAPADGGFYVYIDLGEENIAPGFGSVALCKALLEEEGVAFTPGVDFEDPNGDLGDRRFRISYAGGVDTSRRAMKCFHRFWPTWMGRVAASRERVEVEN